MQKSPLLHLTTICFLTISVLLQNVTALRGQDAPVNSENPEKQAPSEKKDEQGPPANSSSVSYSFVNDRETVLKASSMNEIFRIGTLSFNNMILFEKRDFNDNKIPWDNLYQASEMLIGQNQDWVLQGMISFNSDKPFKNSKTIDATGAIGKRIYGSGEHLFFFNIFYTRWSLLPYKYNIPIPFISYMFRGNNLNISIGIPSSVSWDISDNWSFSIQYMPINDIESSLTYKPLPFIDIKAEFIWKSDKYTIAENANPKECLTHEYIISRLSVGSFLNSFSGVFLSAGYVLRDNFKSGKRYIGAKEKKITSLKDVPVFEAGAQFSF